MMKKIKNILSVLLLTVILFTSCQEDDLTFGDIVAPSNIEVTVTYIDNDTESPAPGLGSGEIKLSAKADNATAFQFIVQGQTKLQKSGSASHTFTTLGTNTYAVTVVAFGTGGASSSKTIEVEVLALYEPPADLLTMLTSNSSRSWRVAYETPNYFGLGPVGTTRLGEYFPNGGTPDKSNSGMYDDRYIFNIDGTFTHDTGADGAVFGRDGLINEIGGPGDGTIDGADVLKYTYASYSESWTLTAPGGVETISLSRLGFIGYYIGGSTPHSYKIFQRTDNTMALIGTDGNNEFDWNIILIAD